jgi:Predicted hydrolase of the HD superfamily (permuted catalytic motifs)
MNTEKSTNYTTSIFSLINDADKPIENSYPQNAIFNNFTIDSISYPESLDGNIMDVPNMPEEESVKKALERCKKKANENALPYILVYGDLSGIQNTVYTISSKGALKSLRARSFMLELLCEHICYELITEYFGNYNDNLENIVFSGGGSFCLLLPNNGTEKKIEKLKEKINDWAFEEFAGKLYISIVSTELNDNDLHENNFRDIWCEVIEKKLNRDKKQKFKWNLNRIFNDAYNKEPEQKTNKEECQICHRDDIKVSTDNPFYILGDMSKPITTPQDLKNIAKDADHSVVHSLCFHLYRLGDKLTKFKYIYRYRTFSESDICIKFPDINGEFIYYSVTDCINHVSSSKRDDIDYKWEINSSDYEKEDCAPFLYANYVRNVGDLPEAAKAKEKDEYQKKQGKDIKNEKETTASFTGLSHAACGADLIGCLRMDVDNMGKIISNLKPFTITHLANISKMLNIFFKVYLTKICKGDLGIDENGMEIKPADITNKRYKENGGRSVSIVYAGGDDLFIVGAWDEVTELSYDIQRCFARYSGMGISAGLTLHKAKFPLYQMAKLSGDAETFAKNDKSHHNNEKELKNRISLFFDTNKLTRKNMIDITLGNRKINFDNDDRYRLAIKWSELSGFVIPFSRYMKDRVEVNGNKSELNQLPSNFIEKLFNVIEEWQLKGQIYIPTLSRILCQVNKLHLNEDKCKDEINFVNLFDNEHIKILHIPLIWISYLRRTPK